MKHYPDLLNSTAPIPDFFEGFECAPESAYLPEADTELDSKETSVPCGVTNGYRAFLISGQEKKINLARTAYILWDESRRTRKTWDYDQCRNYATFYMHREDRSVKVGSSTCKLRFCPLCAAAKSFFIVGQVQGWLSTRKKPKFITLTLKHSDSTLKDEIDSLYKSFRLLRKTKLWQNCIKGGVWFFQVKPAKDGIGYHPHLHILCHGKYIDKFELSATWRQCSKGSSVVDVRKVTNVKTAANYVSRYAANSVNLTDFDARGLYIVMGALYGRRICGTFGTAKGLKLVPKTEDDLTQWVKLEAFHVVNEKRHYDQYYELIWKCWKKKLSMPIELNEPPPELENPMISQGRLF